MTRVKTFNATGQAPDGRLYPSDLNEIQDHFVDLNDFTQILKVGAIQIGDPSLQILKYGAGELEITADLRVDGILRALGGAILGKPFTTTERDALAAGRAPAGLIILNSTTGVYEYNTGTDSSRVWTPLTPSAPCVADVIGNRPSAASMSGRFYLATDVSGGTLYFSNGTSWLQCATGVIQVVPDTIKVLDRSYPTVNVTGVTTETTIYTYTVPGNTLSTDGQLHLMLSFNFKKDTTGADITLRVKFGSAVLTSLIPGAFGAPAVSPFGVLLNAYVQNKGVLNSQEFFAHMSPELPLVTFGPISGIAIDTTTNQNLVVTAQIGSTSSQFGIEKRFARLELA